MLRFSLKFTALIIPCLFLLMAAAVAVGFARPPHPALAGFVSGCDKEPLPCWYGIQPGESTAKAAALQLSLNGYEFFGATYGRFGDEQHIYKPAFNPALCQTTLTIEMERVRRIQLQCPGLTFGDFAAFNGLPTGVENTTGLAVRLLYGETLSVLESGDLGWPSLYSSLRLLDLYPVEPGLVYFDWHGLVPAWRYCQLEHQRPVYCFPQKYA